MENTQAAANRTQASYQETAYTDQEWEVVGERSPHRDFLPMEVQTLGGEKMTVDPMFPDYGGHYGSSDVPRPYMQPGEVVKKKTQEEEDAEKGIIRVYEAEMLQAIADAEERGRLEATERLAEENEKKMKNVEERLRGVFSDYQAQLTETFEILEHNAVDLSISIAEKIIGYAVEINPEYIIPLVRDALKLVGSAHVGRIRVSPQDMEFIEVLGVQKAVREFAEFRFEADDTVRSGCIVETSAGEIDYQLDKALNVFVMM